MGFLSQNTFALIGRGKSITEKPSPHWIFARRLKPHAFKWRSQLPIRRIKEALSEINKAAKKDPVSGAEGAVLFLEKISPAIDRVDSLSGAIGTTVNHAIEALVPIIAKAPVKESVRDRWLERLWAAVEADEIPYLELLPEYWGDLCDTVEQASRWADEFLGPTRMHLKPGRLPGTWFKGTSACLSSLFKADQYEALMGLFDRDD